MFFTVKWASLHRLSLFIDVYKTEQSPFVMTQPLNAPTTSQSSSDTKTVRSTSTTAVSPTDNMATATRSSIRSIPLGELSLLLRTSKDLQSFFGLTVQILLRYYYHNNISNHCVIFVCRFLWD